MASKDTSKIEFEDGALAKTGAGRTATPLDQNIVTGFAERFTEFSTLDVDGETRPRLIGYPTLYDTAGKASSQGSRYKDAVSKLLNMKVSVRVTATGQPTANGKGTGPFKWGLYIPLSVSAENAA